MGIYNDLQNDLKEAFEGDLADAYIDFVVTDSTAVTYDPDTGAVSSTLNAKGCNGIVLKYIDTDIIDLSENVVSLEILVLDSDKPFEFQRKQKITYSSKDYEIVKIVIDPVKATIVLSCILWK